MITDAPGMKITLPQVKSVWKTANAFIELNYFTAEGTRSKKKRIPLPIEVILNNESYMDNIFNHIQAKCHKDTRLRSKINKMGSLFNIENMTLILEQKEWN